MSIRGPHPTRRVTGREWSTICIGVPRHSVFFSSPWSRKSVLPFLRNRTDQANALAFDVREALFALLGKDITTIDGLGPYLSLKLIAECGDDLSSWPSAKHFTSWLGLAPSNKVSGGKMLSSRTRR